MLVVADCGVFLQLVSVVAGDTGVAAAPVAVGVAGAETGVSGVDWCWAAVHGSPDGDPFHRNLL